MSCRETRRVPSVAATGIAHSSETQGREAINAALPDEAECEGEAFWVRSAEVCVDLPCRAASTIVRLMQRAALTGAKQTTSDLYRVSAEDASGVPVVRWWRTENGPCFKVYPKGTEVARAEVGFDRIALCRTLEEPSKLHLDGCLAVRLLLEVADEGAPLLGELVAHVVTGRRPPCGSAGSRDACRL